jgi:HD-GYP domain-containing protein (c-di-GMP phosphodiesterase class II)
VEQAALYNSRIVDNYVKLIKKHYQHIDICALLKYAGMTSYEVADQGHWFDQRQINRFHERLSHLTGNDSIAREAGRFAASPGSMGIVRQYVLGMLDPSRAYAIIGKMAANITRSCSFESKKLSSNKVEINVHVNPGVQEKPFQCENRMGFFESVTLAFSNRLPVIEHPECIFRGDACCRYIISWEKSPSGLIKRVRNLLLLILSLAFFPGLIVSSHVTATIFLPLALFSLFSLSLFAEMLEKNELKTTLSNLRNSTENLIDQINLNYNNSLLTNEIGLAITQKTSVAEILREVIGIFKKRLDYDRGIILLANEKRTILEYSAGYGYSTALLDIIRKINFRLDNPKSKGVFVKSFKKKKPFLVNNINDIQEDMSPRSREFAKLTGAESFICCPIMSDGDPIGILAVDNIQSKRPLVQSDMSLLMGIAAIIGVSIRNADLIKSKVGQFNSILRVLAATIDARDPLTSGHSEKVTEYAVGICEEMGLPNDYREMIRVAALLHDYGKIGVPDAILKKPGKLTDDEFEAVKTHASRTREILEQVNFEGIFEQVPEIAGAHHEKLDGSGYPLGLRGKEIPLGARIIAVADFFEAITSRRHYRNPMFIEKALLILRDQSGIHFDERVVSAFLAYYRKKHSCDVISLAS